MSSTLNPHIKVTPVSHTISANAATVAVQLGTQNYLFTPEEVNLKDLRWYYRTPQEEDKKIQFARALYNPEKTVYVAIGNKDQSRYGTIGVATPPNYPADRSQWPTHPDITRDNIYRYIGNLTIRLDDLKRKPITANIYMQHLFWLPDYEGPSVWCFKKKPAKPKVTAVDKLGHELAVGDFITYVERTYRGSPVIKFGFIQKISNRGIVTAKNIRLSDNDVVRSSRISKPHETACKLNKDIIDELMIKRLTY